MAGNVKPIPEGYHTITPYLTVKDGMKALEFYRGLGAREIERHLGPDGRLMHAAIQIGDSKIMLGEFKDVATLPREMPPMAVFMYVENSDEVVERARRAGAEVVQPVRDQPWGDRAGSVIDPFGITWWIATHKEEVSAEELQRRMAAMARS